MIRRESHGPEGIIGDTQRVIPVMNKQWFFLSIALGILHSRKIFEQCLGHVCHPIITHRDMQGGG